MSNGIKVTEIYDNKKKRKGYLVGTKTTPLWTEAQAKIEFNKQLKVLQKQAVIDSTNKAEKPDKLVARLNALRLEKVKAEGNKDSTSVRIMDKRIKQIENEINKLDDTSSKPTTPSTDKVPVKKQSLWNKIMWGTEADQEKDAWIESHIAQNKEAFVNRELEVLPENKHNPEIWYNKQNKERTNQWYAQKAEEAYAEEMKEKDPAGIVEFIKK